MAALVPDNPSKKAFNLVFKALIGILNNNIAIPTTKIPKTG